MKKRIWLVIALVCILLVCAVIFVLRPDKPFAGLKKDDIASARVRLLPPDETIDITDTEKLAEYLGGIRLYGRDDSFRELDGQTVIFTIAAADGTEREVIVSSLSIAIDGVGYRAEYEDCEKLNAYANGLRNSVG